MQAARRSSLKALTARLPPARPELSPRTTDPVDLFAELLDLRGGVRLSEVLDDIGAVEKAEASTIPETLLSALDDIEQRVIAAMNESRTAFESLRRPRRVLRALQAEGDLEAGARALTERFEEALARAVAKGRADLRALREEAGETLKQAPSWLRALEELDAAAALATRGALGTRLLLVIPAMASAFEEKATARLLEAGATIDLSRVEAFCRPEGWLGRAVAEGESGALALLRVEGGLLLALIEAAKSPRPHAGRPPRSQPARDNGGESASPGTRPPASPTTSPS